VKQAPVFAKEEGDRLWEGGIIGIDSVSAVRAVYFFVGKVLCLHGGQEQRDIKPSHFQCQYAPDHYVYAQKVIQGPLVVGSN